MFLLRHAIQTGNQALTILIAVLVGALAAAFYVSFDRAVTKYQSREPELTWLILMTLVFGGIAGWCVYLLAS